MTISNCAVREHIYELRNGAGVGVHSFFFLIGLRRLCTMDPDSPRLHTARGSGWGVWYSLFIKN